MTRNNQMTLNLSMEVIPIKRLTIQMSFLQVKFWLSLLTMWVNLPLHWMELGHLNKSRNSKRANGDGWCCSSHVCSCLEVTSAMIFLVLFKWMWLTRKLELSLECLIQNITCSTQFTPTPIWFFPCLGVFS